MLSDLAYAGLSAQQIEYRSTAATVHQVQQHRQQQSMLITAATAATTAAPATPWKIKMPPAIAAAAAAFTCLAHLHENAAPILRN